MCRPLCAVHVQLVGGSAALVWRDLTGKPRRQVGHGNPKSLLVLSEVVGGMSRRFANTDCWVA